MKHFKLTTICRFKDSTKLTKGTDYKSVDISSEEDDDWTSAIELRIASDSAGSYTCQGSEYNGVCSTKEIFSSEAVVVTVIESQAITQPEGAIVVEGSPHVLNCKFPNGVAGESYTISWSLDGKVSS